MLDNEKTTAPGSSAATDGGQPCAKKAESRIADGFSEINSKEYSTDKLLEKMYRLGDPRYLYTLSMDELYDKVYEKKKTIIDGLLYSGTYLLAGSPKVGKSFLVLQFAYHISTGTPLWDYPAAKGTALYLALEDDYTRLQQRLYKMYGTESTDDLHLAIHASTLENELYAQLEKFIKEHPDTKLIIIDTLQKIRTDGKEKYSYANDYDVVAKFKELTDRFGIALLLVHHTRKQQSDDKFEMVSGTNGLLGAADGAFVLQKTKRTDKTAVLDVVGRDQQDQKLHLVRNQEKLTWELERAETELWKELPDPFLVAIDDFIDEEWAGSATQLADALHEDIKPNKLSQRLNVLAGRLENEYGIRYTSKRTSMERTIILQRLSPNG